MPALFVRVPQPAGTVLVQKALCFHHLLSVRSVQLPMKGAVLCPLLLAATLLLLLGAAVEVAAEPPPIMKEGDPLVSLIYNSSEIKKRNSPREPALDQMLSLDSFGESKVVPQHHGGAKAKDKIAALPNQPDGVDFNQYGGYVNVNQEAGRALFYYFTEAPEPADKPLLVWFNGGPGCSSIGYGAMEELGPFRVMSDGKTLYRNPFAWNRVANVLYYESPAGVGFSYSNTTSDYSTVGDTQTAEDSYVFLVNWLERFPEYKSRDLFLVGESYAGHFVPQLAQTILQHNQFGGTVLNLKAIAIGNAVLHTKQDQRGTFEFYWAHAFVSDTAHRDIRRYCNFTSEDGTLNDPCMFAFFGADGGIMKTKMNIYNIYGPRCIDGNLTAVPKKPSTRSTDPCSDYYVHGYLNEPEVQKALHADVPRGVTYWNRCTRFPTWADAPDTVVPVLKELMDKGLRIWVYSGDIDGRIPVTSTRFSLALLRLPVKTPWKAWRVAESVAGYTEVYEGNLTLATVRGAGHMVPSDQGPRALVMISAFLEGKPLPAFPDEQCC